MTSNDIHGNIGQFNEMSGEPLEIGQQFGHSRFDSDMSVGANEDMIAQLGEQYKNTGNFNFENLDSSFENIH